MTRICLDVSDEELTATPGNRRKRVNATKVYRERQPGCSLHWRRQIHKVNQKGETMLQQACIAGNSKEVQRLLSQVLKHTRSVGALQVAEKMIRERLL